jgi:hypothetical protein
MEINNMETNNMETNTEFNKIVDTINADIKAGVNADINTDAQPETKTETKKQKMPRKPKVKKTENINAYMANYMKKQYENDPAYRRHYANSISIRKKYIIDDTTWKKYGANLHNMITLKEIISYIGEEKFNEFLQEYKTMNFEKREPKKD